MAKKVKSRWSFTLRDLVPPVPWMTNVITGSWESFKNSGKKPRKKK